MKLNSTQLRKVEQQLGVAAVPEDHPVTPNLTEAFGEHTFFLDAAGLNIVDSDAVPDTDGGAVVKLASWTDEERRELRTHEPEILGITVDLEPDGPDV